jgi:6-phosphogluconolactonase
MLTIFSSPEELASQAAGILAGWIRASRGDFHLALSGGSTPRRLFAFLRDAKYADLAWERVQVYWCDERCVPPEDAESNYGLAQNLLLRHVPIAEVHIHRIHGELPPEQAARGYAAELAGLAQPGRAWPRLDAALLGLGEDGHTASLFPGATQAGETDQPVIPVSAQYQRRPAARVTLTPLVFNTARRVVFLVSGAGKAAALAGSLDAGRDPVRWPAQRIHPTDGEVFWWADAEAAAGHNGKARKRRDADH